MSSFRKGCSTIDAMIRLETDGYERSSVAVFSDIEKVHDMLWKEGLMMQLKKLRVGGHVCIWILSFLFGRNTGECKNTQW